MSDTFEREKLSKDNSDIFWLETDKNASFLRVALAPSDRTYNWRGIRLCHIYPVWSINLEVNLLYQCEQTWW